MNDALYDNNESGVDDYLSGGDSALTDNELAGKGKNQLTPILSTKCFELSEPNFGSIRCTDEGMFVVLKIYTKDFLS